MRLHKDILTISFKHRYQIRSVFKEILGLCDIQHFSLDLVTPSSEMLFFSSTPSHGYEICKRGYGQYDGIISPGYYENFEFYWWENTSHKAFSDKIAAIREGILGLRHGFMLVRKWNDFHLIYSFATKSKDHHFQSMVLNNVNELLKMGDFAYMEMREAYAGYCGEYTPPSIEQFYGFKGGMPPARYTKDYKQNPTGILKNVTRVDFKRGIVIGPQYS